MVEGGGASWPVNGTPELPTGTSQAELANFMNNVAATQERHDLELSINSWGYKDGFIDIFWDESKISSINGDIELKTGSNSEVSLLQKSTTPNKAGDENTYTGYAAAEGARIKAKSDLTRVEVELSSQTDGITRVRIEEVSTGDIIATKTFSPKTGGDIVVIDAEMNNGSEYDILLDNQGSDYTTGTQNQTSVNFPLTSTYLDIIANSGGSTAELHNVKNVSGYVLGSNGSITHERKQLTDEQDNNIIPSKLVANPEYDSSGTGESVEMVVSDNSGNSETLSESDFGTEVNVSFADGNIQVETVLTASGTTSPKWYKTKLLGVDN